MGTWAIPDTDEKKRKVREAIDRLELLKRDLHNVYGDDELFDHLDAAIAMLDKAITS